MASEMEELAQLKGKLWYHIEMILQDIESQDKNVKITHSKKYINALMEVVLVRLQELTSDLEQFSEHDTGRSVKQIQLEDLKLYLRNSPHLRDVILPGRK